MTRYTLHIQTAPGCGWGRVTRDALAVDRALSRLPEAGAARALPVVTVRYEYPGADTPRRGHLGSMEG